jgi:hypothetical protein
VPLIEEGRDHSITGWGEHAAVCTPECTYIGRWSPGAPFEELYDVRQDPLERQNIAAANTQVVKDFRQKVKRYVDEGLGDHEGLFRQRIELNPPRCCHKLWPPSDFSE